MYTVTTAATETEKAVYALDYSFIRSFKTSLTQQFTVQAILMCPTDRGLKLLSSSEVEIIMSK